MKLDDAQRWIDDNGPDHLSADLDDAQQWIDHNGLEGTP